MALCARLADELLADIREVVQQMRRSDGMDLGPAIEALATPFPRPRLHLQIDGDARVGSLAQAEAVLRAVQEGLTNAARHSQANNLWVVLAREPGGLRLDIRDDGRGSGEVRAGNGLCGMRERLEALGGGLSVGRTGTGGMAWCSSHLRTRSASWSRLSLPVASRNTMISLRPATWACITRQRPASEM